MPTLLEISKLEQVVLFDSSIEGLDLFFYYIYDTKNYSQLSSSVLTSAKESTEEFLEFIQEDNTFTVKATIADFQNLVATIGKKQKFLNDELKKVPKKYLRKQLKKKSLLENISDNIYTTLRTTKSKIFIPSDNEAYSAIYKKLFDILPPSEQGLIVANERWLQLYAAAFYLSLQQRTSVALTVNSIQFTKGLAQIVQKILTEEKAGFDIQDLKRNPIKLYYRTQSRGLELVYSTSL